MANYSVNITNGTGSERMQNGTYTVSAEANGYSGGTLSPTTFTVTSTTTSGAFTLTATGTLTFIVNDIGDQGGTPVTGGSIIMTNSTGTMDYGVEVNISSTGTAVFNNVPYGSSTNPYTLYFRQKSSDSTHNPYEGIIEVNMVSANQTQYLQNTLIPEQNITLTDATYSFPVEQATLTFTGQ